MCHKYGQVSTHISVGDMDVAEHYYPLCGDVTETEVWATVGESQWNSCKVQPGTYKRRVFY